jgi:hypothetical protein
MERVKDIIKSNKDLEAQIQVAAYFCAQKNHSYNDLCYMLAERLLKIDLGVKNVPEEEIRKKAEKIFYSGIHYDKLCWLIAEIDVIVEKGYFDI